MTRADQATVPQISSITLRIDIGLFNIYIYRIVIEGDYVRLFYENPTEGEHSRVADLQTPEEVFERVRHMHIGGWKHFYRNPCVLDGKQWELRISYSNGAKDAHWSGCNAYPYNFNELRELFYVNEDNLVDADEPRMDMHRDENEVFADGITLGSDYIIPPGGQRIDFDDPKNNASSEIHEAVTENGSTVQYRTKSSQSETEQQRSVQAFINNVSAPKTLEELQWFMEERDCFDIEVVLSGEDLDWSAPRWAKPSDIVFFMHAKCANSALTKMRSMLTAAPHSYDKHTYETMMEWIARGLALHKRYGGKIVAIGHVCGMPEFAEVENSENVKLHWGSHIFVDINKIQVLEHPIDISEFNSFILVSRQSGITPVFGSEFARLKELISSKNKIPAYLQNAVASPLPLAKINAENYLSLSKEYRHAFMLENQFRTFYVDYLLHDISDIKTIYRECRCKKQGIADSFVDNIIKINGKYLPVEVKLSIACEVNIFGQVAKYCHDDLIIIDANKNKTIHGDIVVQDKVLIIDTEKIYLYNDRTHKIQALISLDDVTVPDDVSRLKKLILERVFENQPS